MAQKCQNCGKGVQYGNFVSHAKNRVKRLFKPNLKRVTIIVEGKKKRLILCTSCVRTIKKQSYK
ncbi:50S ribosomal protein L28 [Microgenomates group bacterium]|nr:50S ribosomal protein L28 [Microgenomates group bacterium]